MDNVKVYKWDLFSDLFPPCKIKYENCQGKYVSDVLNAKVIESWVRDNPQNYDLSVPYRAPVIISAQTGKGKNYFITHTLMEYAKKMEEQILYVSNRVALDFQQKKDLANEAGIEQSSDWEKQEKFANVTVLTYHKLLGRLQNPDYKNWAGQFTYVVLDECHFFYSDAYFNPFTWEILDNIIETFHNRVRIYLSATPEDVIDPIRYLEGCILEKYHPKFGRTVNSDRDKYIRAYNFPRDFTNYSVFFFSNWESITEKIAESNEKWIIFVTSKDVGQKMKEEILSGNRDSGDNFNNDVMLSEIVSYIDRDTRNSDKFEERYVWDQLLKEGKFRSKVLITTSVLDNGFSIKDNKVKNIVLFTHDRTEFLQELGRCRITSDGRINLYVCKLTPSAHERRKQQFKEYTHLMEDVYGDGTAYKKGDIVKTAQNLWNQDSSQLRGCISLEITENRLLRPAMNEMARWRTCILGRQISEYEQLLEQGTSNADALYKAKWLDKGYDKDKDIDYNKQQEAVSRMEDLLEHYSGKEMRESEDDFIKFSEEFFDLFIIIDPKNTAINRGRGHRPDHWKGEAIKKRLQDLKQYGLQYTLERKQNVAKNDWIVTIEHLSE